MYIKSNDIKPFEKKLWLSSPTMHGEEQKWVDEAIRTNWVSTVGENINEVEKLMSQYVGVKHAVGLSCGTAALHYYYKKQTTCIMRYRVPGLKGPCKFGVATIDSEDLVLKMTEKPQIPESEWAVPPFYIYKKSDLGLLKKGIESGCKTDAPGSFIEWICKQTAVHAYEMPGQRFDVGSIEGYEKIKVEYQGIVK